LNPNQAPFVKESAIIATIVNSEDTIRWTLSTTGDGPFTEGTRTTTIPLSQLELKGGKINEYTPTVTTPNGMVLDSGGIGTFNVAVDYRLQLYWSNPAASDYQTKVWYTLTGE
jgi:hypothetical protein